MRNTLPAPARAVLLILVSLPATLPALAAPVSDEDGAIVSLADGKITMKSPAGWLRRQPRVRIIDAEFAVPPVEGDENDGRATIMAAGGSVQANIDRWKAQFTKVERSLTEKKTIAGQEVHVVDLAGVYNDQRGPFAPAESREGYRMLGAIIATKEYGKYFVKFYGPAATVAANEKAFYALLDSLTVK
jgi:hypothetical protein